MLKKIMIGAGLATIVATSAMAQSYQPEVGSGNIVPNKQEYSSTVRSGDSAFAFQRSAPHHHMHHSHNLDRD